MPCLVRTTPSDAVTKWAFDPLYATAFTDGAQRRRDSYGVEIESLSICRRLGTAASALRTF
eukprot:12635591-Prorocentrum_lima.AAC.1